MLAKKKFIKLKDTQVFFSQTGLVKVSPCLVTKAIKNQQPFTPSKDVSHK